MNRQTASFVSPPLGDGHNTVKESAQVKKHNPECSFTLQPGITRFNTHALHAAHAIFMAMSK